MPYCSLRVQPHRERDGADNSHDLARGPEGEAWMGRPEDPSFQYQPRPGLSYVREKNGVGPMSLCGLLGYTPFPLNMPSPQDQIWLGGPGVRESGIAVQ